MKKALTLALVAFGLVLAACGNGEGSWNDRHGIRDGSIGQRIHATWDVVEAPDGVGNVFTTCSPLQSGKRLYMVTHNSTDVQPVVVDDTSCTK